MHDDTRREIATKKMLANYMEAGFLENIIDMFRDDAGLFTFVSDLIQDERVRVRIGITALMEEMKKNGDKDIVRAVPNLLPLLAHPSPVVRGDTANLLGIIGDPGVVVHLKRASCDPDPSVRLIAEEALEAIGKGLQD